MLALHPPVPVQSPVNAFSLLFMGDGFTSTEFPAVAADAWRRVTSLPPLNLLTAPGAGRYAAVVYVEPTQQVALTQSGRELQMTPAEFGKLAAFLAAQTVQFPDGTAKGSEVWPWFGPAGPVGSLVAVLKKGSTPGELYGILPDDSFPIRRVATVVTGDDWWRVLARALGQVLGGLADEWERPEAQFRTVEDGPWTWFPNVIFALKAEYDLLKGGADARSVFDSDHGNLSSSWGIPETGPAPKVVFRTDGMANPKPSAAAGPSSFQLVEGGGYHRFQAFRSDFDCLMRRKPADPDPSLLVAAPIGFCRACDKAVRETVLGEPGVRVRRMLRLDTQTSRFHDVALAGWETYEKISAPTLPFRRTIGPFTGADKVPKSSDVPKWQATISVDAATGLTISDVKLHDRPRDPFKGAVDVMKSIAFDGLAVRLGSEAPISIDPAKAFATAAAPPVLEIGTSKGPSPLERIGVRLTLTWQIDKILVEAAMSVVFRGPINDFDPGGAAWACKLYPQLALSWRPAGSGGKKSAAKLPDVTELHGAVVFVANNRIPPDTPGLPSEHRHMANGKQSVGFFTDSNASNWDSTYTFKVVSSGGIVLPSFGTWDGTWINGRKLARIGIGPIVKGSTGATARVAHTDHAFPGLPDWSWLFDFAHPFLSIGQPKRFVAVHAAAAFDPSTKGARPRSTSVEWPAAADQKQAPAKPFRMTIAKVPRQGAYDNVHLYADMGTDDKGRTIVPAPFCADLCMHLHWRWGIVAADAARRLYAFLGWGNGKGELGGHALRGAPLVPPNQHVEIAATNLNDQEAQVRYEGIAYKPGSNEKQVLLEQGIGLAFNYAGLSFKEVGQLGAVLGVKTLPTAVADDDEVRMTFHMIYPTIRWYDETTDNATVQQIPGTASDAGGASSAAPPKALEDL
jgi:hypothetical protein